MVFHLHTRLLCFLLPGWLNRPSLTCRHWSVPATSSLFSPGLVMCIPSCTFDCSAWLSNRCQSLNVSRPKCISQPSPPSACPSESKQTYSSRVSCQNLCIIFAFFLSRILHFQNICQSYRFYFQTQPFVHCFSISTLVQANTMSHLVYWKIFRCSPQSVQSNLSIPAQVALPKCKLDHFA